MRVIAGEARSVPLKALPGLEMRPTTDRIKETLFNILQNDVPGCMFLDLFAGSGQMGIEALSRGAQRAVFIEKDKKAIACIEANLQKTKLSGKADVLQKELPGGLSFLGKNTGAGNGFDLIFLDPPYAAALEAAVVEKIMERGLLAPYGKIIMEMPRARELADVFQDDALAQLGLRCSRTKCYKTNKHVFLEALD